MVDRVGQDLERHLGESAHKGDEDLVFAHPESGNALDASALRKRYTRARQAAGVRPVRFHDLRHTFGTRMAAAGVPMRTLQEWMGHRDILAVQGLGDLGEGLAFREQRPDLRPPSIVPLVAPDVGQSNVLGDELPAGRLKDRVVVGEGAHLLRGVVTGSNSPRPLWW